jgi:hypothetical protein
MVKLNAKQILDKSISSRIDMKFTDFINLKKAYVDAFFHNLQSDIPIYMSEQMLEYFEYDNKTYIEFIKEKEESLSNNTSLDKLYTHIYYLI